MITENDIRTYVSSSILERGRDLYYEGHVGDVHVERNLDGNVHVYAYVRSAHSSTRYQSSIWLDSSGDRILDYDCTCPFVTQYSSICKHIVAVLFKLIYEVRKLPDIDEAAPVSDIPVTRSTVTDRKLKDLVDYFQTIDRQDTEANIHLDPACASQKDGSMRVSFTLHKNQERSYIIKNLHDFVTLIKDQKEAAYGKNLSFVHSLDSFADDSKELVKFLLSLDSVYDLIVPTGYYSYYSPRLGREITIKGKTLDDFMNAMQGRTISIHPFLPQSVQAEYVMTDGMPDLSISLTKKEESYTLSSRPFDFLEGMEYLYFLDPETKRITRMKLKDPSHLLPFLRVMKEANGQAQYISGNDLPEVAGTIYPSVSKALPVDSPDFPIEMYLPVNPDFSIYLDMPQNNMITCRLDATYGNEVHHVLDETDVKGNGRNLKEEKKMDHFLTPWFNSFDHNNHLLVLIDDDDKTYALLTEGIPSFQKKCTVFVSDRLKALVIKRPPHIHAGVSVSSDLLNLDIHSDDLTNQQLAEILSRYDRKKKFYRLKDGTFVETGEELDHLNDVVNDLQITKTELKNGNAQLPGFRALYVNSMDQDGFDLDRDEHFEKLVNNMQALRTKKYEVPDSLKDVLREYQKDGFSWLCALRDGHFAGLLADEMGLGKTLQVIAFLLAWKDRGRTLIICPASLVYNWANEFHRFAPELPVEIISGNANIRKERIHLSDADAILITSYDLLKRDVEAYADMKFSCQVIDEAQYIKNANTQASRAVKRINSTFRIALTGTPIENRLSELWSIFDYLMPGLLFPYARFRSEIEEPIVIGEDEEAQRRLQNMTGPFILRRLKKDVLKDLPPKMEEVLYAELTGEQKDLYNARVQRLRMTLDNTSDEQFKTHKIEVLSEITRLRQLCCGPELIYENYKGNSAKEDLCMDLIASAIEGGHKILLFSQFTSMLNELMKRLDKEKIRYHLITGATPKKERFDLAEEFATDDVPLFCISLKAGGTGLNLAAADVVIHYDPWWNTAVEEQASDRAHRIGQKNVVTVYRLIMKDTIEEKIIELQERKAGLAEGILSAESMSSSSFTREDLLNIL